MSKHSKAEINRCFILCGDSREKLLTFRNSVDLIVTSPPYADARKKHYDSMHPDHFAEWMLTFHDAFWESTKEDGSLVINIKGKAVGGMKHRFVWRMVDMLCDRGWKCIEDYIWHKTNPMPGYWPTRLRDGWEYCFHFAKTTRPYVNQEAVRVPIGDWVKSRLQKLGTNDLQRHNSVNNSGFGRNISKWVGKDLVLPTNVLSIPLVGKNKGHPAVFPVELPAFFIKLLSRPDSLVADPFGGSGSTAVAALQLGRDCVVIDNNPDYCRVANERVLREAKDCQFYILADGFEGSDTAKRATKKSIQLALDLHQMRALYLVDASPL